MMNQFQVDCGCDHLVFLHEDTVHVTQQNLFSCDQQSVGRWVNKNSPLTHFLTFCPRRLKSEKTGGQVCVCMCVRGKVYIFVPAKWLKVAWWWEWCKTSK